MGMEQSVEEIEPVIFSQFGIWWNRLKETYIINS